MTTPFVRYFAVTDDSPTGNLAYAYMIAMVRMEVPVRLVTTSGGVQVMTDEDGACDDRWGRFRDQLVTPVPADYVNVVCAEPGDWVKRWTAKVHNILVVKELPLDDRFVRAALEYQAILVPTAADRDAWLSHPEVDLAPGSARKIQWILAQAFHDAYAS